MFAATPMTTLAAHPCPPPSHFPMEVVPPGDVRERMWKCGLGQGVGQVDEEPIVAERQDRGAEAEVRLIRGPLARLHPELALIVLQGLVEILHPDEDVIDPFRHVRRPSPVAGCPFSIAMPAPPSPPLFARDIRRPPRLFPLPPLVARHPTP